MNRTKKEINKTNNNQLDVQEELLKEYGTSLIIFSLIKNNDIISNDVAYDCYSIGKNMLYQQLLRTKYKIVRIEEINGLKEQAIIFYVDANPIDLKRLCITIEDNEPLGCLFDYKVISYDGFIITRNKINVRKKITHIKTSDIQRFVNKANSSYVATLATRALLYEVSTAPKPGLVDRKDSGSHNDMDFFSFINSASSLYPFFEKCYLIGKETSLKKPRETFKAIRWPGMEAEGVMLASTNSSNTHKGAIFSIGIICAAIGRLNRNSWANIEKILKECSLMTKGLIQNDFKGITLDNATTAGQKLYVKYGITGVRGEVENGFPTVINYGLPVLENGLKEGKSIDISGCAALLTMLAHSTDTNMISRSNLHCQKETSAKLLKLLKDNPYPNKKELNMLNKEFINKNLSPGGCADLLAVSYLLHFLKEKDDII